MYVSIKKLFPDAVIPSYAHPSDAGMDLVAIAKEYDEDNNIVYHTGLAFEIPEGYVGLVFPRSSVCKKDIFLTNAVGVIDAHYRGEVTLKFKNRCDFQDAECAYEAGERVGQIIIMPYPHIEFIEEKELSQTDRGAGGYGSTGK